MSAERPFFLNLMTIRLPVGGWTSILHRVSGAMLAVVVPAMLYLLMLSLRSPEDYARAAGWLGGPLGWLVSVGLVWGLLHHFFAGLRHLGFDLGWGEERERARQTAWASLLLAAAGGAAFALWRLS
jgi:succinate dehydrogenase / fumarate reductase, cytochrome b subunit